MNLIVACDQEYSIAKEGKLLTYLPEDLKRFKKKTMGNIMIMGRKTIDSLPGGSLLPNRETWILTRDPKYTKDGAHIFHSLEEIKEYVKKNEIDTSIIFVCGGAEIYQLFLPYCSKAYMTMINQDFVGDAHIPNMNTLPGWYLSYRSEEQTYKDVTYQYMNYENKSYTHFTL